MPYPQSVADSAEAPDDVWMAQGNADPWSDKSRSFTLNDVNYPGWAAGDFPRGEGLLGVRAPASDLAMKANATAAVNAWLSQGYSRRALASQPLTQAGVATSGPTQSARSPIGQGFSDGFVDDFKDIYYGLRRQREAWLKDPVGLTLQAASNAVAESNPFSMGQSIAQAAIARGVESANGLDAAVKTNAVPYFIGNQVGQSAANLTQFMAADAVGKLFPTFRELPQEASDGAKNFGGRSNIDRRQFGQQRPNFWRQEAQGNAENYHDANLARMKAGKPPIGVDGHPMELHHIDGTPEGGVRPMTRTDHRLGPNYTANHPWIRKK